MRSRVPASRVSTWLTALALAVAAWVSSSCREASEVQVLVQTNLPWDASKDMSVAIFFGPPGHVRPAPAAVTRDPWGADGHVGTLTAIPAGDSDAPLEMRVVMAIGRAPDTCTTKDAAGCIIERRRIRFIPHQSLRVPVTLWLECTNVGCTDDTTCNYLGRCVSSSLDENTCLTPAGCLLEGDPPYGASPPRAPDGGTVGEGGTPGGNPGAGNPGGDPGPGSATGAGVCVNGTVSAIATSGTKVFFGGDFTRVGRCVGSGVELSASTGAPVASGATLPKINGPVNTVVSDGMGGWFVGGGFDHIGATPRANLAHILASGAVDTAWRADTNGPVYALTTADRLLYVGGAYSTIGGAGRPYAAAVGFATGGLSPFNPVPDGIVNAIAVAGNYAYLGGTFMTVTGASKPWLAQVSATTGMISPAWTVPVDNFVSALATDGTTLFIGGAFSAVNTAARGKLAAVNLSDAALSTWNPGGIGITQIDTLAISGTTVYVGGVFLSIGTPSQQRRNAASITVDGLLTSWFPEPDSEVKSIAVTANGGAVYLAGSFTQVGGSARRGLAAVALTGAATTWNPSPIDAAYAVAVSPDGASVFAGGVFNAVGAVDRASAAAIDSTGAVLPWNPHLGGSSITAANAMTVVGSNVWIGGTFATVNGSTQNNLTVVEDVAGAQVAPLVSPNGSVNAMLLDGTTLYFGGAFTSLNGTINRVAAMDATNKTLRTGFAGAVSDNAVNALAIDHATNQLFLGGSFVFVNTLARHGFAGVDATTGTLSTWDPAGAMSRCTGRALAVANGNVIVGGVFSALNAMPRLNLAMVDPTTATPTAWAPEPDGVINAVTVSGATAYLGGAFNGMGPAIRSRLAAVDVASGVSTAFDPNCDDDVRAVAVSGSTVYAGGLFTHVGGAPHSGLVKLDAITGAVTW